MAGLIFIRKCTSEVEKLILNNSKQLNYSNPRKFIFNDYTLFLFPKINGNQKNYFQKNNAFICGVGTFIYKGKVYEEALPLILKDYINNTLEYASFVGEYMIYIRINDKNILIRDGSCLKTLYFLEKEDTLSTSFDMLIKIGDKKKYDKLSLLELLTTGLVSGRDTIIQEIKRVCFTDRCSKFRIIEVENQAESNSLVRYKDVLNFQKNKLVNYFSYLSKSFKEYNNKLILDIGVTAGLDSRLMVALADSTFKNNYKVHTHWRKEAFKNLDYKCAYSIANELNLNITSISPDKLNFNGSLNNLYEAAYNACDGVIRPGCYWDEYYSTLEYRSLLSELPTIRFLGFGGEQYRNANHYSKLKIKPLKSFIKWDLLFSFMNYDVINDKKEKKKLVLHIKRKIEPVKLNKKFINLTFYKKYIKYHQSPSYRCIQSNIENKIGFSLNPFMDINLTNSCIKYSKKLGISNEFQIDIINLLSKDIASIENDYGYNFSKGEPFKNKILAFFWMYSPVKLKYKIYQLVKKKNTKKNELGNLNFYKKTLAIRVQRMNLPINISKYICNGSRSKLLFNLGYFDIRNEKYIQK